MNNDRLKHYADTFDKEATENEDAANAFLQDEDFIVRMGGDWVEAKAKECREKARLARGMAAELRALISN